MIRTASLTPLTGLTNDEFRAFVERALSLGLPEWIGDRPFLVVDGTAVSAAFYVRERAFKFAYQRGYALVERG